MLKRSTHPPEERPSKISTTNRVVSTSKAGITYNLSSFQDEARTRLTNRTSPQTKPQHEIHMNIHEIITQEKRHEKYLGDYQTNHIAFCDSLDTKNGNDQYD